MTHMNGCVRQMSGVHTALPKLPLLRCQRFLPLKDWLGRFSEQLHDVRQSCKLLACLSVCLPLCNAVRDFFRGLAVVAPVPRKGFIHRASEILGCTVDGIQNANRPVQERLSACSVHLKAESEAHPKFSLNEK